MGLVSGLAAALTYRALRKTASAGAAHTSSTVGRVARVIVPMDKGVTGKVRIQVQGQSVDLMAKTTGVRIIPVPGRQAGDVVEFGGLFGTAPIMEVRNAGASAEFVRFGGRIPAPIQSLSN